MRSSASKEKEKSLGDVDALRNREGVGPSVPMGLKTQQTDFGASAAGELQTGIRREEGGRNKGEESVRREGSAMIH